MDLIEATVKALQGKLEEKPNKSNAELNAKILEPNVNKTDLQRSGYNVERADGFTAVKRADREKDFREVDVFDDGAVVALGDKDIKSIANKEAFDAKSFLDTDRKKPYEAPNKVSKFKMNKDTIAQADDEIADAEREKEAHPEDADILDKNVIEPWQKLKDKAGAENKAMLNKKESRRALGEHVIVEDKECLKEETLTWEDIMTNAEGTTFGQQALKVKDTARDNVEKLLVKAGIDIDNVESVEDEIEKYCKDNNIKFDTHGNLITECEKVTEDVVTMEEAFYAKICKAYVNTANLEWVTTNPENDSVVHGYFANDDVAEKYDYGAKVTPKNFKDVAYEGHTEEEIENGDVEWYDYDTWEDFYEDYVKGEILYDIDDIGTYPGGTTEPFGEWDFYISKEDLIKLGLWNEDEKVTESVVSDYTLSEIKRVLDSEETEYGYSLKITNSGADEETRTLDLDKSDLQAIYDALSKNKVTESKVVETVKDSSDTYSTKSYYIELPSGMFGVSYTDKDKAIKTFTDLIAKEKNMDSEHWNKQAQEYEQLIADGKVQVVTITKNVEEIITTETLSLNDTSVQLGEAKVRKTEDAADDIFSNLQKEIRGLSDANLDYKGMCSLIAGYIQGMVGIDVDDEALAKINIDLVREIADAVFNEDSIWEPMDDFIYSTIYEKLGIE